MIKAVFRGSSGSCAVWIEVERTWRQKDLMVSVVIGSEGLSCGHNYRKGKEEGSRGDRTDERK